MSTWLGRVLLRDAHGLGSSKNLVIEVDDVAFPTAATQFQAANVRLGFWVQALDAIIDCVIEKVTLTSLLDVAGLKTVPGDQGTAEGANLVLATIDNNGDPQERPYWLPGASAGIFNPNFRTVDAGDQDLIDWVDLFPGADIDVVISDGEVVTGIVGGVYATRRRTTK
jgi:hypothetical protein